MNSRVIEQSHAYYARQGQIDFRLRWLDNVNKKGGIKYFLEKNATYCFAKGTKKHYRKKVSFAEPL